MNLPYIFVQRCHGKQPITSVRRCGLVKCRSYATTSFYRVHITVEYFPEVVSKFSCPCDFVNVKKKIQVWNSSHCTAIAGWKKLRCNFRKKYSAPTSIFWCKFSRLKGRNCILFVCFWIVWCSVHIRQHHHHFYHL